MKKIILAASLAAASVFGTVSASQAATVTTVVTSDSHRPHYHRPPVRHCYVKKVKSYHHGAVVWKTTRVCR